jgi:O-antigen/teichoic acid export membrane protein
VGVPLAADAAAAAVDVGVAFALVPGHGALGAAIASACGLLVAGAPQLVYAARLTGPLNWEVAALGRGMLVAATGGAAAYGVVEALGGATGVVAGLIVGAAVFLGLALLVGFLPRDDAHWLQDVIGTRAGRLPSAAVLALAGRRQ